MPQITFRWPLIWVLLCSLVLSLRSAQAQPQERPPHLVTGRFAMPAVAVGSAIYVVGGVGPAGYRTDLERIETAGKSLVVSVVDSKLLPRMFHTAEASGPFIYVMGGVSVENEVTIFPRQVERFDTRDGSVQLMAPLPMGLRAAASALVGDKIYLAGGMGEARERVGTLLIYDIDANSWKEGAPMPEKKECDLLGVEGGLLALGGFDGQDETAGVQSYDIATDTWKTLMPLPFPTSAHHGAVIRDETVAPKVGQEQVVLFGDYTQMDRVQSGNPRLGKWQAVGDSGFRARRHGAVVALGTKIYVIGGNIASVGSFFDDIQAFDAKKFLLPPAQ